MERPEATAMQYNGKIRKWLAFNEEGHEGRPYDPHRAHLAKWRLFAGWLFARSRDKDLNGFRSAINRYLEDEGAARQLLGRAVNRIIKVYGVAQQRRNAREGRESELNRVPCPEVAVRYLLFLGESNLGLDLLWTASLLLMLLCWFRASTVAGLRGGDVRFAADGSLLVVARVVKGRPELVARPALMQIPPAPAGHPRARVLNVIRRLLQSRPTGFADVRVMCGQRRALSTNASARLTAEFRRLVPADVLGLPEGAVVASQSFREMGASAAVVARYNLDVARRHGLWVRLNTMLEHYVFDWFPASGFLERLFDWMAGR